MVEIKKGLLADTHFHQGELPEIKMPYTCLNVSLIVEPLYTNSLYTIRIRYTQILYIKSIDEGNCLVSKIYNQCKEG